MVKRFDRGSPRRKRVSEALSRIYRLASGTGELDRFIICGSYVTSKPSPNDIDILLVMRDTFKLGECDAKTLVLFDHERADRELGASIFWARSSHIFMESMEEFIAGWQEKRDHTRRGIVEVI